MSTNLISLKDLGVEIRKPEPNKELIQSSDFLPQLLIAGGNSTLVKEGLFPIGHFMLYFSKDSYEDLGQQIDCLVIGTRERASVFADDNPVSYYGNSKDFQEILAASKRGEQGYLAGYEYLIWLPSVSQFALFLMGNKTLRKRSGSMYELIEKAATLKIELIKNKKHTWHGCEVFPCTTPFDLPEMSKIKEEAIKFNKPPKTEIELIEEGEERER